MDEDSDFVYRVKDGYTSLIFSITGEGISNGQKLEPDTAYKFIYYRES